MPEVLTSGVRTTSPEPGRAGILIAVGAALGAGAAGLGLASGRRARRPDATVPGGA